MQTYLPWLKRVFRRFRWTDLQIKRLCACPTADEFREALDTIPKTLEETYHRALETIPEKHQKHVRKVLIWLASSFRELTSLEVAAIVSFPFVEDVLRICTSVLVTVINGDTRDTIKLAHFTVKEFLIIREGPEEGLHWYRFTTRVAHQSITAQTLDCAFDSIPAESRSLCWYARRFWPAHARETDKTSDPTSCDEVQSRVNSILEADHREQFLDWLRVQYPNEPNPPGGVNLPLYYASLLGLERSVIHFWKDSSELNLQSGYYGNALDAAACMGHVEVVMCITDRLEVPCEFFNLARIVQFLRVNVAQTIRALLWKGYKPMICTEVVYGMQSNSVGQEILRVCLEEDLADIHITEELVEAAAHNTWNRKIMEYLVRSRPHEFPLSLRALLAVANTSLSALQMLADLRKAEISFSYQDCLFLATEKSAYKVKKLLTVLDWAFPYKQEHFDHVQLAPQYTERRRNPKRRHNSSRRRHYEWEDTQGEALLAFGSTHSS